MTGKMGALVDFLAPWFRFGRVLSRFVHRVSAAKRVLRACIGGRCRSMKGEHRATLVTQAPRVIE
jgi:hypothetical protein